jgi:predicted metalloprotease
MRWRGRRQSSNIRDVRGGGGLGGFGRGGPFVVRRAGASGGFGIGTILVLLVVAWLFGINPLELLSGGGSVQTGPSPQVQSQPASGVSDEMRDFVATVLADTEDTWSAIFSAAGEDYPEPTLTLFSGYVQSACGTASAATGPFYCPADANVYIDLAFYGELRSRFGAPGDFAQAYVLAHEVGHHVQNVLGLLSGSRASGAESQAVRTELQADCFAGIWANHTSQRGLLEEGDIEEAMTAAAAVGDDRLQEETQGRVVPDSFTHGTSEQRVLWFRRGFQSGDVDSCDTSGEI